MNAVLDERAAEESSAAQTCGLDDLEAELRREIEAGINETKAAISGKLKDGRLHAQRLLKRGRYAIEDGVSELAHQIKKNPISFLAIAFVVGTAFGLLSSPSSQRRNME